MTGRMYDVVSRAMGKPACWLEHKATDTEYAVYKEKNNLIIWFEGSSVAWSFRSVIDWLQNFNFFTKKTEFGKLHRGYWKKYCSVRNDIMSIVATSDYDSIEVRGFSQGGALAQLCYFDIQNYLNAEKKHKTVVCYAVGSPRIAKKSNLFRTLDLDVILINLTGDIVPYLPFFYDKYGVTIEIGEPRKLLSPFRHWWSKYLEAAKKYDKKL